jgi:hypothetical protein
MSDGIGAQTLDKLITDFQALTFVGGSSIFASGNVRKLFLAEPSAYPICEILPSAISNEIEGNSSDIREYDFEAKVEELIESSLNETQAGNKIGRLANTADAILDYLQKLPNNLEYDISGVHIIELLVLPSPYDYRKSDNGIILLLTIQFRIRVSITPQLL